MSTTLFHRNFLKRAYLKGVWEEFFCKWLYFPNLTKYCPIFKVLVSLQGGSEKTDTLSIVIYYAKGVRFFWSTLYVWMRCLVCYGKAFLLQYSENP